MWLDNRTGAAVDLSCWTVASAASGMRATVAAGTRLAPHRALHLATPTGLLRSPDTVTLADRDGSVEDRTPSLSDSKSDDQLWYLAADGSWQFGRTQFAERASDGRLVTDPPEGC